MKNEIVIFENQNLRLEVNMQDETVWLTQEQISKLFGKSKSTINEHIQNIYKEQELDVCDTKRKFGISEFSAKPTNYYNLDVIISVGYRVKSPNGILFRRWANKILKEYLLKGYAINQQRLEFLEKTVKLIDIANRNDNLGDDASKVLKVIANYSKSLNLLDDYDHQVVKRKKRKFSNKQITYEECIDVIRKLKFNESSNIFALERNQGLKSILRDIYQTFDGKDVYPSLEEKSANFLYMIVKDHVFIDGNKKIAATLFLYFLNYYDMLYVEGNAVIDNNTLTALTLMIAGSDPKEKEIIIDLITNFYA